MTAFTTKYAYTTYELKPAPRCLDLWAFRPQLPTSKTHSRAVKYPHAPGSHDIRTSKHVITACVNKTILRYLNHPEGVEEETRLVPETASVMRPMELSMMSHGAVT